MTENNGLELRIAALADGLENLTRAIRAQYTQAQNTERLDAENHTLQPILAVHQALLSVQQEQLSGLQDHGRLLTQILDQLRQR